MLKRDPPFQETPIWLQKMGYTPEFEFGVVLVLFAMAILHFGADGPLLYVVYASHAMGKPNIMGNENLYTSINGNPNLKTYKSKT